MIKNTSEIKSDNLNDEQKTTIMSLSGVKQYPMREKRGGKRHSAPHFPRAIVDASRPSADDLSDRLSALGYMDIG